ncbi:MULTISPECIES: hypothetical protein [unclassified Methylobacterium]|jgi:hypothetical protein|uniref:hypothetical protein n=1 Tax=unclassified Methylobacterium TaxID=2615210 RepID=UPI0013555E3D|nr:hypothetical protein [Methylobacterium sp. 2A]MWV22963.1 hypothetical protein [Methylobacterium sp. 2A]
MPDLTIPLLATALFVGVGWLIVNAGRHYDDAIGHTLKVFALVLGLVVMAGVTAKLRAGFGVGRMAHRIEARAQDGPAGAGRTSVRARRDP